jgi:uncharacterized protein
MEFDNSFEVPLPVEDAWKVLMDIPRIAPCMPGAQLTEVVDPHTYKGRIAVRLGPVALSFAGTVRFDEIDEAAHKARIAASGSDTKGRGSANAAAAFHLEPVNGGSKVLVHTNLVLSGSVAQYGRGVGIIHLTAAQIITRFANNLKAQLAHSAAAPAPPSAISEVLAGRAPDTALAPPAAAPVPPPSHSPPDAAEPSGGARLQPAAPAVQPPAPAAKPISGFALMANVLWQAIKRLFSRA